MFDKKTVWLTKDEKCVLVDLGSKAYEHWVAEGYSEEPIPEQPAATDLDEKTGRTRRKTKTINDSIADLA